MHRQSVKHGRSLSKLFELDSPFFCGYSKSVALDGLSIKNSIWGGPCFAEPILLKMDNRL